LALGRFIPVLTLMPIVALVGSLGLASSALGQGVYRYTDDRGVVHFSDLPRDARYAYHRLTPAGFERGAPRKRTLPPASGFDPLIAREAQQVGVEPALVKAVIAAESAFDPRAVSRKGARGLMQLMPATARDLGVRDSFEPAQNIRGGTRYLRRMLDRYGDVRRALAAYNAGPTAVDRYRGVPPYEETQTYVVRVLDYYRGYHGDFRR